MDDRRQRLSTLQAMIVFRNVLEMVQGIKPCDVSANFGSIESRRLIPCRKIFSALIASKVLVAESIPEACRALLQSWHVIFEFYFGMSRWFRKIYFRLFDHVFWPLFATVV